MSEHLALLTKMQRAHQAVDELAEEGHRAAKEHLFCIDLLRGELGAIDDLLKPHFMSEHTTIETVRALLLAWQEDQKALIEARATVARLEDADRLGREAHMAVVERARLAELAAGMLADEANTCQDVATAALGGLVECPKPIRAVQELAEKYAAVVAENVRLREEVAKLRAILTSEGYAIP